MSFSKDSVLGKIDSEYKQLIYSDEEALKDLTDLVAAVTSGIKGVVPESEDQDLAEKILKMINTRFDDDAEHYVFADKNCACVTCTGVNKEKN